MVLREQIEQHDSFVPAKQDHGHLHEAHDYDAKYAVSVELREVIIVPLLDVADREERADEQQGDEEDHQRVHD